MGIKQLAFHLLGDQYTWLAIKKTDWLTAIYSHLHPYHFNPQRYEDTFLVEGSDFPYDDVKRENVDRVIYVFWTGDNEITPNRLKGIASLEKVSGIHVQLITPRNLDEYLVDDDPLPEAYQYLSLNHRSDFLRGYFMYHHGGGYADIKTYYHSWIPAFEKLDSFQNAYAIGYPEIGFDGAANQDITNVNLKEDLHYHWRYLIGNGAFICRPHTVFTAEWYTASRRRLVNHTKQLRLHPAKDVFGTNEDYPLPWAGMQGEIFHPFCLKYHEHLLKDKALMPSFENYR